MDPNANTDDGSCLYYDNTTVTGVGTPYWLNDSCYSWVVYEVDPYCLTNQWDSFCQSQYDYCKFGTPIGLDDLTREGVSIFPNPTQDKVTIKSTQEISFIVYDLLGKSLVKVNNTKTEVIDLTGYSRGIYNIQIDYKGIILNHKIIKQ